MSPVARTRSSQTDIINNIDYGEESDDKPPPEHPITDASSAYRWQRSASCKELDRGETPHPLDIPQPLLDKPITRYDDTRRSCYSVSGSKTPSLDRSHVDAPETKVYSSSYPGTTSSLSTESGGGDDCVPNLEAGGSVLIIDTGSSHEEMVLSHDDLSHDSYELLEREHCELYGGESHSLSIDSAGEQLPDDEMFVMDDDFDSKDNSDVEKRLGYVEPRYAGMDFNEFNEKCKQEIANKRAVEFHEFDAKCKPGMVIGFDSEAASTLQHFPVERTKSDPYVSDFWKVAKQHRRLLHQKSIDLTPTESSVDSGGAEEYNKNAPCTSKSVIDIPYTLHKRHHLDMYASERPHHESVARSPQHISPKLSPIYVRKSPEKSPDVIRKAKSPKKVTIDSTDRLSKTKTKPDLNSQDSGLSLSLGTESVDDLQEVLSRNIDNIDNIVGIEFEGKGDAVERKIIKEKVDSRQSSFENVEMDTLKVDDDRYKSSKSSGKKEHFVKGKSEENTRSRKGTLSKVRHVHSADGGMRRDSSFDKREVQVIKIDSDSSQDVCSCGSDRKETRRRDIKSSSLDSSDPDVIIVEYRGNRKKAFQKRASSGSKDSTDKESKDVRRGSSLDLPKSGGSKESKRSDKQSKDLKQEFKDSKKKSGKLDRNKLSKEDSREKQKSSKTERDAKHAERMLKKEDSLEGYDKVLSDDNLEKPKSESVTSIEDESTAIGIPDKRKSNTKTVVVSIEKEDNEVVIIEEPTELQKRKEMLKEIPLKKNEDDTTKKTPVTTPTKKPVVSPETTWKKFGELPAPISHKRERSPILFARLGLSEGSTFAPNYRQASVVSPSSSRRAKSLDAPVVSLHRLPPVTSFSSKDDTLENDEDEFEEKTQRHGKQLLKDSLRREENQIEEEQLEEIVESVEMVVVEKSAEKVEEKSSKDKPKVVENIHRPMEDLTAIGNSSGSSVELPEELSSADDNASGGVMKGSRDDISVTLEKLDEVVDRVKDNTFTNKKGTKVDNLVLDNNELKEGLSPCLSPNTDTKSPCLSPKDLPPRSPCLSPNDPPHSPCRVPAGEPSPCAERRPSTRKERLDSFKNTKSYSVDIWTSEETDAPGIPTLDVDDINIDFTSNDYDDETFITEPEKPDEESDDKLKDINIKVIETVIKTTEEVIKVIESCSRRSTVDEDVGEVKAAEVMSTEDECWESTEEMPNASEKNVTTTDGEETEEDNKQVVGDKVEEGKADVKGDEGGEEQKKKKMLSELNLSSSTERVRETLKESLQLEVIEPFDEPSTSGVRFIPEKRSFDEEPSSSSSKSVKPELSSTWKPFPLESSGSSSLEEGIFPPDDTGHYADEEEGSSHSNNGPDDFPTGFGYPMTGAEMIISGYTGGMFGLSRTLSRISERSTTSEQERSDFEDDISTKPSSRSLSVDDESLLSSDRQPSLSSDPPSATDIPFEDRALPDLPPLPPEPRRSTSLLRRPLPLTQEEEWPSPPDSDSPFDTPVISHVETFYMEIKPEEATKVVVVDSKEVDPDNGESSTDENKTLQEETTTQSMADESEGTVKLAAVRPKSRFGGNSASEDTSVGVCADFSSSSGTGTGTTVKHCQYYSCTVKSDDNSSLAGDFGLSLSTEMISSRKSSDDATEKFHTKPSGLRLPQRSFDDYDSPCTDSDEGQAAALISPTRTTLKRRLQQSPSHQFIGQRSGSVPLSPTGVTGIKKFMEHRSKHRMGMKCTPYYSAPVPVSHEIRDVSEAIDRRGGGSGSSGTSRSIARSKCYSYYSLARDPPSDGSSSSLDNQDPPTAPNTIPRVSKKRRHHGNSQLKRFRHRVCVDMEVRDGHIVSVSSPSVIVACGQDKDNNGRQQTAREAKPDNGSRSTAAASQQQQLTKQSSV
ncbi:uncharacterized protein LOC111053471 [Nilaparvata lugens]|uniref:uncharacterized protein LOC111053471 n=1 Tax=Nilaparvata lugens TaxID=108931 RepID=UPI00193D8240|nr:uncharacterized protein LOC111053471 [Nilaparvata lugens]